MLPTLASLCVTQESRADTSPTLEAQFWRSVRVPGQDSRAQFLRFEITHRAGIKFFFEMPREASTGQIFAGTYFVPIAVISVGRALGQLVRLHLTKSSGTILSRIEAREGTSAGERLRADQTQIPELTASSISAGSYSQPRRGPGLFCHEFIPGFSGRRMLSDCVAKSTAESYLEHTYENHLRAFF